MVQVGTALQKEGVAVFDRITKELKEKDQMKWIQEMNNIQNCVEEVINKQIIHI